MSERCEATGKIVAEWVHGYEGKYAITRDGRLFSFHREYPVECRYNPATDGYVRIRLWDTETKTYTSNYIHRLVALTYLVDRCTGDEQVDHIDGNRNNNTVENLRWVSPVINCTNRNSYSIPRRRVTEEEIECISNDYLTGNYTQRELSMKYNRHERTINRICNGKPGS